MKLMVGREKRERKTEKNISRKVRVRVGVNFINVFRARFLYKILAPSYVSAWQQKFVQ
jgi:hypothetical protein